MFIVNSIAIKTIMTSYRFTLSMTNLWQLTSVRGPRVQANRTSKLMRYRTKVHLIIVSALTLVVPATAVVLTASTAPSLEVPPREGTQNSTVADLVDDHKGINIQILR
jgi:hypothetical protein